MTATPSLCAEDPLPLAAGSRSGGCDILAVLGCGPIGAVYQAFDTTIGQEVVLHEYLPRALAERVAGRVQPRTPAQRTPFDAGLRRFTQQASALMRCSHPSLPRVHHQWMHAGTACFSLERCDGPTLQQQLHGLNGLYDRARLPGLLRVLAYGLHVLHRAGGVQGNAAPTTIRVVGGRGAMFADIGTARIAAARDQPLEVLAGYAAPEQYEQGSTATGPWTDVYGLGALAYRLVVGVPPPAPALRRDGDTVAEHLWQVRGRAHVKLLHGLHRALSLRPQDRMQNMVEFLDAVGLPDRRSRARSPQDNLLCSAHAFTPAAHEPAQGLHGAMFDALIGPVRAPSDHWVS